jgi:hypothetical protein
LDCGGTNELRLEKANDDVINYDFAEAAIAVEGSVQSGMQNQNQDAKVGDKTLSGTFAKHSRSRPHGLKAAKKRRMASSDGGKGVEEQTQSVLRDLSCSSLKLSAAYEESQRQKIKEADRKAAMEEKRLQMKKYELILGESSVASTSENRRVMKILLNSVLDEHHAVCRKPVVRNLVGTTLEIADSPSVEDPVENENDIDDHDEVVHS